MNRFKRLALKTNYILNNYGEVVWLIGDGRSGTTWVSNIINYNKRYREMFEPFHPKLVKEAKFIQPHQYVRPGCLSKELELLASRVFSGNFYHQRVDSGNRARFYKGILVKDIFANLFCYPVCIEQPRIRPILLLRNPFSVALSKYKKRNWFWCTEPLDLLNQPALYADYLAPLEDLIKRTSERKNYILNQVLIWSIINYVPIRQFKPDEIHICFYENIYMNPGEELLNALRFVRKDTDLSDLNLSNKTIASPSKVSGRESNIVAGKSPVLSWKNELPAKIIDDGLKILERFGIDDLYGNSGLPNEDVIRKIQQSR